ncbi:MAG TPA: division/cell wall cluster transcriptional repressor MraZ [Candidatus Ruthenibacterium avium]|uniref:Transcriptional regulator MraZ n=1 Tax=Candidatus Ruthenibacterium avium TaxID=2838751 RepID=A0A9D2S160_9FIRM|nr:division/cell wall cluster transcriptional repressor MraZ [Candidatus Ruthenibacterium avium]
MLIGEYQYTIDEKGRMNFPAKFREEMGAQFIVTRWLDQCLVAFSQDEWQRMAQMLAEKSVVQSSAVQRFLYASAAEVQPDKQGRILLTAALRAHACLKKDITVIGVGSHAEIWDTDAWKKMNESLDSDAIAQAMKEMGF